FGWLFLLTPQSPFPSSHTLVLQKAFLPFFFAAIDVLLTPPQTSTLCLSQVLNVENLCRSCFSFVRSYPSSLSSLVSASPLLTVTCPPSSCAFFGLRAPAQASPTLPLLRVLLVLQQLSFSPFAVIFPSFSFRASSFFLKVYQKKWTEAVQSLQHALRGYPTCADWWEALGLAYQRLGSGNIYLTLGTFEQGVYHFRQALEISPHCHRWRASLLKEASQFARACAE
ncbi:hypothetical protein K1719_044637, partial [Acacia pycnantha]